MAKPSVKTPLIRTLDVLLSVRLGRTVRLDNAILVTKRDLVRLIAALSRVTGLRP